MKQTTNCMNHNYCVNANQLCVSLALIQHLLLVYIDRIAQSVPSCMTGKCNKAYIFSGYRVCVVCIRFECHSALTLILALFPIRRLTVPHVICPCTEQCMRQRELLDSKVLFSNVQTAIDKIVADNFEASFGKQFFRFDLLTFSSDFGNYTTNFVCRLTPRVQEMSDTASADFPTNIISIGNFLVYFSLFFFKIYLLFAVQTHTTSASIPLLPKSMHRALLKRNKNVKVVKQQQQ